MAGFFIPNIRLGVFIKNGAKAMIKKGDIITMKPEWQDAGDARFTWVARNDEEYGRVDISVVELAYRLSGRRRPFAAT
jgi:hypothetical protein